MDSRFSWWLELNFFLSKLVYKYERKIHWKNDDEWFINSGDIRLFYLTKHFIKEKKIPEGLIYSCAFLRRLLKSSNWSFRSNIPKTIYFFRSWDFNFFALFCTSKIRQSIISTLLVIWPFMKFCVASPR